MKSLLLSMAALTMFSASAQIELVSTPQAEPKAFSKIYYVCKKGGRALYHGILYFKVDLAPEQRNCSWEGGQLYWSTTGYPW
ncbi:hypothetical protein L1286_20265 [Pseudoalteromonas sp. SMS1]|uniref:hypothetical protein n=1 Tax=Pseudoalteromonas sp. SMS1 TaxID=2908894 RepID=UPI001F40AC12|nr:hypothetical protein [Pseudoalteromonas sp. SMS1]MCF2859821.1 hypothetical protein [Pseudoalteromonas sp. SMS1]